MMTGSAAALAVELDRPATAEAAAPAAVRRETITFRDGLLGFPECRDFLLQPTDRAGFFWLQSLEYETLAFLLIDPFRFFEDYEVELGEAEVAALRPLAPSDLAVLAIVTLPRSPDEPCTANLQGPVVVNLRAGLGRQLVLADAEHGVRRRLDLDRIAAGG